MAIRAELPTEELNMTPLIDVVFNLLIFFLLGSTYLSAERELEVQLPEVSKAKPLTRAPDEITINVAYDGRISIEEKEFGLDTLKERLSKASKNYPEQVVAIRGDGRVPYERIAQVIAVCRESEIRTMDLPVLQRGSNQ